MFSDISMDLNGIVPQVLYCTKERVGWIVGVLNLKDQKGLCTDNVFPFPHNNLRIPSNKCLIQISKSFTTFILIKILCCVKHFFAIAVRSCIKVICKAAPCQTLFNQVQLITFSRFCFIRLERTQIEY